MGIRQSQSARRLVCREEVREWFRAVLRSQTKDSQDDARAQRAELARQESLLVAQQDKLLDQRLRDEVDQDAYAAKQTQLRDRLAAIKLQRDALDRSHDETADLASRVFELSQTLTQKWLTADVFEKRRILEIVFLNCTLDDVTLVATMRKPFDRLSQGLFQKNSRGDRTALELFSCGVRSISAVLSLAVKGLAVPLDCTAEDTQT